MKNKIRIKTDDGYDMKAKIYECEKTREIKKENEEPYLPVIFGILLAFCLLSGFVILFTSLLNEDIKRMTVLRTVNEYSVQNYQNIALSCFEKMNDDDLSTIIELKNNTKKLVDFLRQNYIPLYNKLQKLSPIIDNERLEGTSNLSNAMTDLAKGKLIERLTNE